MDPTLLAKQCWRLASESNSLLDILSTKVGSNPSCAWCSILEMRKVIEKGLRWKAGSVNCIKLYKDPWLPKGYPFRVPIDIP